MPEVPGRKTGGSAVLLVALAAVGGAVFIHVTSAGFPDVPATRFGLQGDPVAWMTRDGYRAFMTALVVGIPLLIVGLPGLIASRWPALLNIPNREYWLHPERAQDTVAALRMRTAVLAGALILLLCFVHTLVRAANTAGQPVLDHRRLFIGIGIFLAFQVGWVISLRRRFART